MVLTNEPGWRPAVVLGGYGRVGSHLCERLAQAGTPVVIAGRSGSEAERRAAALRTRHPAADVRSARVDAEDPRDVSAAAAGASVVVVAARVGATLRRITAVCLEQGCDCVVLSPSPQLDDRDALAAVAVKHRSLLVTHAGVCPGLPSALVRAVIGRVGRRCRISVGIAVSLKGCTRPEEAYAFVDAAVDYPARLWESGEWRTASRARRRVLMDYGSGFGERLSLPTDLAELHGLEREPGVDELGAYAATPAWRADVIGRAVMRALYRVRRGLGRRTAARLLVALAGRASAPTGVRLLASGVGEQNGGIRRCSISVAHDDVAEATAIAVAAFLRQLRAGACRNHLGLGMMGHLLDVEPALDHMQQLGMRIERHAADGQPLQRASVA